MEEEFLKNKNMMRLERSGSVGMGIRVWRKKNKRKKKRKEKEKKRMDGRGGSIKNKKIKNHN